MTIDDKFETPVVPRISARTMYVLTWAAMGAGAGAFYAGERPVHSVVSQAVGGVIGSCAFGAMALYDAYLTERQIEKQVNSLFEDTESRP